MAAAADEERRGGEASLLLYGRMNSCCLLRIDLARGRGGSLESSQTVMVEQVLCDVPWFLQILDG